MEIWEAAYLAGIIDGEGTIISKKNYNPELHKDSFTLSIKKKESVMSILKHISPYLRIHKKKNRALWILDNYNNVTPRNGKYSAEMLKKKLLFEEKFFQIYVT